MLTRLVPTRTNKPYIYLKLYILRQLKKKLLDLLDISGLSDEPH